MDHPHEPMDVIYAWQEWAKNNRTVAQMDEPLLTKDSRENLHDTSHATAEIKDWRSFFKELAADPVADSYADKTYEQKATEYFADTIVQFINEIGGIKLYECFVAAAKQNYAVTKKEYDNAKNLIDLLDGNA